LPRSSPRSGWSGSLAPIGASPTDRILELGCGPGFFSPHLAKAVPDGHLELCDLQAEMIDLAAHRLTERGVHNFATKTADARTLPYPDDGFDAAVLVTVLGEVPDTLECLIELARVVRSGGRLLIDETRLDPDFIPLSALRAQASIAGFALDRHWGKRLRYTARFVNESGTG
jgi:ubiquinone/menaquinone biosynthesis C-methylase UbiE